MSKYTEVDEYCLTMQEYAISLALSKETALEKAYAEKCIEAGIYRLTMTQKLPADILQQDQEICRYPSSNWQWFKKFIPFMKPKYRIHTVTEHLTFPKIAIPKNIQPEMRVFFEKRDYVSCD